MKAQTDRISCAKHGQTQITCVCSHLVDKPGQRWHCNYPTKSKGWPDAWCDRCNRHYVKEGQWNKNNEGKVKIKLLCSQCYESGIGQSVSCMPKGRSKRWNAFVSRCCRLLAQRQNALSEKYHLNDYKRWDWDQKTGELIFSNDGVPGVIAKIAFVGSVSTVSNTWLWAWANFHLLPKVRNPLVSVRDFGESRGFSNLTVPKWPAEETDGWHMAAVSAYIMNAPGVYRTPDENGYMFMVLQKVRFAKNLGRKR